MKLLHVLICAAVCAAPPASAAVIMQVPGGYYQSASDSPYFAQIQAGTAFLNDFSQDEDGYFWVNSAGQTVWHEYSNEQFVIGQSLRWEFAERIFNRAGEPGAENFSVDGMTASWTAGVSAVTGAWAETG